VIDKLGGTMSQIQEVITSINQDSQSLYDRDFGLWIETTVNLLKQNQFEQIDLGNLIEEIESMGRKEKSAVRSNLIVVLIHLLKWKYQSEKQTNSWKSSIREHRRRLRDDFKTSPSLKPYFMQEFAECYQDARELAADETGLELQLFPIESPFTPEQALDPEFLP
jgi:Domain of unknown function DUF29